MSLLGIGLFVLLFFRRPWINMKNKRVRFLSNDLYSILFLINSFFEFCWQERRAIPWQRTFIFFHRLIIESFFLYYSAEYRRKFKCEISRWYQRPKEESNPHDNFYLIIKEDLSSLRNLDRYLPAVVVNMIMSISLTHRCGMCIYIYVCVRVGREWHRSERKNKFDLSWFDVIIWWAGVQFAERMIGE